MTYTISNLIESGESHETYGTKYIVKFAESPETFELWFKKPPATGSTIEGTIDGTKFKKAKTFGSQSGGGQSSTGRKPYKVDNSDGQRQGMTINNAAQYVQHTATKPLSPVEWADAVYKYATALYSKGDLKAVQRAENVSETQSQPEPTTAPELPQELTKEEVLDLFKA